MIVLVKNSGSALPIRWFNYLVRNSEMGWEEKMGERSPLAIRWISGWRSSYVTTGTLALNVSRSVAPPSPYLRRYSVSAFWLRISPKTLSCTAPGFLVISSISCSAFASLSDPGGPIGDGNPESTVMIWKSCRDERDWERERDCGFVVRWWWWWWYR